MNGALQADGVTPIGLPGGCTRDLVHKFYQEQYQLDGGKQDRYVTGSDSVGTVMGYYDSTKLRSTDATAREGPRHASYRRPVLPGGVRRLYLNHQYLIAAPATPLA
jgi:phospholipase C